jgi:hypothetical protein
LVCTRKRGRKEYLKPDCEALNHSASQSRFHDCILLSLIHITDDLYDKTFNNMAISMLLDRLIHTNATVRSGAVELFNEAVSHSAFSLYHILHYVLIYAQRTFKTSYSVVKLFLHFGVDWRKRKKGVFKTSS